MFVPAIKTGTRYNEKQKHYPKCVNKALAKNIAFGNNVGLSLTIVCLNANTEKARVSVSYLKNHEKLLEQQVVDANNTGAFYKHVNSSLAYKTGIGPLLDVECQLVTDDLYKSELLNKYFTSVGVTDNGIKPSVLEKMPVTNSTVLFLLKPCKN